MNSFYKTVGIWLLFTTVVLSQCPYGGTNSGTVVTPTSTDQFTGNLRGGRYFTMNVVSGGLYTVSTIGLAGWDTQLTIHDTSGNFIDYNDDFGGALQSEITFIAPLTGQVRVLLNRFNCQTTNGGTTTQVRYSGSSSYLTVNDISVAEEDGTATFTVTYNGAATSAFNVDYATADGTAEDVFDYSAMSGTLSFTGTVGENRTVAITLVDNTFGENTEEFYLVLSNATNSVDIANFGTATIIDTDPAIPQDVPLALYDDLSGNFDYTVAGGTFRTQSNTTDACAITTTSSGSVTSTIPAGAVVKRAYLYWAHSNNNPDNFVTFEGQSVEADLIYGASFTTRQFYGYISDVTAIVNGITNPNSNVYDVTDLNIDDGGDYCNSATVLGAWSLMIFYEEASLPAATINLYYGFDITQNAGTSFTLDNFYAISPAGSKATFLSYEGDATLDGSSSGSTNPEELSITNQLGITNILSGDGGQTGNNAYNSTIYDGPAGVNNSNIYGLDLDTYDISSYVVSTDTQVTANVDVGQDLLISSAVLLRVPSNLISGTVFEDINYPGGNGRNLADASGIGLENVTVELYDATSTLISTTITDSSGNYSFGGMADGSYTVRVVNSSILSSRGGGAGCTTCYAVQTFKTTYNGTTTDEVTDEVGGTNPAGEDTAAGILAGAQTVSSIVIASGGIGNIDFGFNFNTIVNTNENGQGSLEQFIVNSNSLDETGLNIQANSIFDPATGEDTSIFMIPPTADPQGRTADANFNGSYFDIALTNSLTTITSSNTHIDGRTQTAYSTDTNSGTVGASGATVGTSAIVLPNYDRPEIQVHTTAGDVFIVEADNTVIRNLAIYATNNAVILQNSGTLLVMQNVIGLDAIVSNVGIVINGGTAVIDGNYMRSVVNFAIGISGGTSSLIQNNHFFENAVGPCSDTIALNGGTGIVIQNNLITNTGGVGIDGWNYTSPVTISENTIHDSGQNGGNCSGSIENAGVRLYSSNSVISKNIIRNNGGPGLVITGGVTTGNLVTQNSFYGNGTTSPALGIDIDAATTGNPVGDGVNLNDNGDVDSGPNSLINFPIIASINKSGSNMVISGWSRPGAIIEFFLTDINEGSAIAGDNTLGLYWVLC
ncbi:beta strand repeat-containing protein [Croceitalea marina]|uniref:Beta strand repeat-containing protein n=1 Tax=Croceitalea marina TaxID=1775166 RepID=A0ABW5MXW8_9FLAO